MGMATEFKVDPDKYLVDFNSTTEEDDMCDKDVTKPGVEGNDYIERAYLLLTCGLAATIKLQKADEILEKATSLAERMASFDNIIITNNPSFPD